MIPSLFSFFSKAKTKTAGVNVAITPHEPEGNMPTHVALIMDGNGRWAESRNQPRLFGHKKGVDALKKAIEFAVEHQIKYLSAWAFSTANWKRPQDEISGLMTILRHTLEKDLQEFHGQKIKLKVIGFLEDLDPNLRSLIQKAEETTKNNTALTLIIQFNYDGKRDLVTAMKSLIHEGTAAEDITDDLIAKETLMGQFPDPDLVIRTSGVVRLSNYMLWQCAFSEFVFLKKNWPDFTADDFKQALEIYQGYERKFGDISRPQATPDDILKAS